MSDSFLKEVNKDKISGTKQGRPLGAVSSPIAKKRMNVPLTARQHETLRIMALEEETSIRAIIHRFINEGIKRNTME